MRSAVPRSRRRRAVGRALALPVLLALAVGLAPAPAVASEPAPTAASDIDSGTTGSTSSADSDSPTTYPAAALSAVVALAQARQAGVDLHGFGGGVQVQTDQMRDVADRLAPVLAYVTGAVTNPPVPPREDIDLAETEAELQRAVNELRYGDHVVPEVDLGDYVTPPTIDLSGVREKLDGVVATLLVVVTQQIVPAVADAVPTADEVGALAAGIQQFVGQQAAQADEAARAAATALQAELATWTAYLTDERHAQTVRNAVTTLLLALGDVVDPLPSALAPTAATASDAAGAFVAWADDLAQQGATAESPFYDKTGTGTGTDEAAPDDGVTVIDSNVTVAEEPVVVEGPRTVNLAPSGVAPPPTAVDGTVAEAGYDCGGFAGDPCAPPMRHHGGDVVRNPVVRVVLAGSWWRSAEGQSLAGALDNAFGGLSGSDYQGILQQYPDLKGYISRNVDYQGSHIVDGTPPPVVAEPGRYAVKADNQRTDWKTSTNVVWVVVLPEDSIAAWDGDGGATGKCGYQAPAYSGDKAYILAVVDFPHGTCKATYGVRGGLTVVAVHEYVGAVTNPFGTGWRDGVGKHLPDTCRRKTFHGPGGELVHMLWSNGARRCVPGATATWSYRVAEVVRPVGDGGAYSYTKGHAYPGAVIRVVNTGNMPWTRLGAKKTYLATADDSCSPFTDSAPGSRWASCRRIEMEQVMVLPGETADFTFTLRPDGSIPDAEPDLAAQFRLVAGTTWLTNTGATSARFTGMSVKAFAAELVAGNANAGYVAAGQPGTDAKVTVTIRNTGTATWFPREVVTIGTPPGADSPYAAPSWPTGPGGCRKCRAHRLDKLVPPGGLYSFDLTLRIPDSKVIGKARFYPYADVRRVSDKSIASTQMLTARIEVTVIPLPRPAGAHEVDGAGFADHGVHADDIVEGTAVGAGTSGFSCAGHASADAVSTRITSCTAQVTSATGSVWTAAAPSVAVYGPAAATTARVAYDSNAGDTVVVCWMVESEFLDGTLGTATGCG